MYGKEMSELETSTDTTQEEETFLFPEYRILIWNDETSDFRAVLALIQEVFSYPEQEAYEITLSVHENTNATVWSGTYEVGELRLEQAHAFIKNNEEFLKELKLTLEEGS